MTNEPPFVSVLIPVRNEERYIERCLYAVAAQDYPRERLEVIVIDGMSSDDSPQIVTRFGAESTIDLRLLRNPARLEQLEHQLRALSPIAILERAMRSCSIHPASW